ncbi:MAG: hypothetical protein SA339_12080 [Methanomassiliicoccus sp.]|nr:hypothetical protein [Methanomassiliicoccus sp.]
MIDVEDVILQRIDQLEEDEPNLETDYELIAPDNYGVITVLTEEGAIGAEFVESDLSWARNDAVEEYNEAAKDGLYVAVIVPNEAYFEMVHRITRRGKGNIEVYSYESLGILSTPMAG